MAVMGKGLLIVLAFAVLLGGCGSDSPTTSENWEPFKFMGSIHPTKRYESALHPDPKTGLMGPELKPILPHEPPPVFLAEVHLIEGIGGFAQPGAELTVQYVGADYGSGRVFASSWDEGKPFTFTLGKGAVIEPWEEALAQGEVGDRTELVVPPGLSRGPFPRGIPKSSTVIFVIELLAVNESGASAT
ncbi:MAG TPA: FKBP-type peptidyl-prolyl cis-trans isomerase [Solirubrobacterales bacterium]|nr:FKBP-type peptidyl-prolyl cis-trans isomerase [Solirubrobacterales bacterium]